MKKASKPAGKTPTQKKPAQGKPAPKKSSSQPKRKAQGQAQLAQVVAQLATSAEKLAQAADRLAEATLRQSHERQDRTVKTVGESAAEVAASEEHAEEVGAPDLPALGGHSEMANEADFEIPDETEDQ
jgi:hypothetical protein